MNVATEKERVKQKTTTNGHLDIHNLKMVNENRDTLKKRKIKIVELPTNLGLSKMPYAKEPGVRRLPQWLNKWGLHSRVAPYKTLTAEAPTYTMDIDPITDIRNANAIVQYAVKQSDLLEKELSEETFLIILGGDCSILIGSALALRKKGKFGLFYLDGHTDYIKPEQSHTHGAAGMDLAMVCGYGHPNLTNIQNLEPYFEQQHVYCVGNREYNDAYEKPIKESKVSYIPLHQLRKKGSEKVVSEFLAQMDHDKLDGFLIHFDVDVLNDSVMPAVDSRQNDGLTYTELKEILIPLLASTKVAGIEITILDPDLDRNGKYTKAFIEHFISILQNSQLI